MTADLMPFRDWCRANGFGITTAYKLANSGAIRVVKVGRLSMVTRAEAERFVASLPSYNASNAEA